MHAKRVKAVLPWFRRGFWAVVDQALFALANFMLFVLLARMLPEAEFGAYTIAMTVFYLACAAHQSLIVEPMLVFGASRWGRDLRAYLPALMMSWNGLFGLVACLGILAGGLTLRWLEMRLPGEALIGVAAAVPFVLLFWMLRRVCYLLGIPGLAAAAGAVYLVVMLGMLPAMHHASWLTLGSAPVAMAVAALAACALLLARLSKALPPGGPGPGVGEMGRQHLSYGKWSLGNQSIGWFVGNMPFLLLPVWFGLEAVATFKILNLLFMPLYQTVAALSTVLLPALARSRGTADSARLVRLALGAFITLALGYGLALAVAGEPVVAVLYGGKYAIEPAWILLLAVAAVFFAAAQVHVTALRAMERPDCSFKAYLVLAAALIMLIPLYPIFGISGVALSQAAGWGVALVAILRMVRSTTAIGAVPA